MAIGGRLVAAIETLGEAEWGTVKAWIDRNTFECRDDTDRVNRIRSSPSFS